MRRATFAVQVGMLARRSVVRTLRQPAMVVPSLVFPLMLLAINSSGLDSATLLPGFPTDSYFQFALAIPFVQGALFSANSAGTNVASDIESGFLNRLALTPLRRVALMMGQLAGIVVLGLIQAVTFVLVGVAFGEGIAAGVSGALVIIALSLVISLAFGCIGAFVALRSGSGEAVNSSPKAAAVRLSEGEAQLADVVRSLDAEDIHVQHLQLHAPTLDDVFLAKTGRSLEGAGDAPDPAEAPAVR